jgi:hypothetical protein
VSDHVAFRAADQQPVVAVLTAVEHEILGGHFVVSSRSGMLLTTTTREDVLGDISAAANCPF